MKINAGHGRKDTPALIQDFVLRCFPDIFVACMRYLFVLVFSMLAGFAHGQPHEVDLRNQWLVYQAGQYLPFTKQRAQSIHLNLTSKEHYGLLQVIDRHEFTVFVDGQLAWRQADTLTINTDSLLRVKGGRVQLSISQEPFVFSLQTKLVFPNQQTPDLNLLRPSGHFSNFVILATFFMLLFSVALFRANPQLTFDYLNIIKLVSLQERDEASVTGRIGASHNLLYFAFVSFGFALLLLILFHYSVDRIALSTYFITHTTAGAFATWLLLSVVVFAVLMFKLLLIFIFSQLFGLRDTVRFQFFHFVRLLFISGVGLGVILVLYFIFKTSSTSAFASLLLIASIFIIISVGILFLKLLGRTGLPVFHLFSYLCASEIIPLIILGKVLLF